MKFMEKTSHFDNCSAPICIQDDLESMSEMIWYPDEDICSLKDENNNIPIFIKQQRKIAKRSKKNNNIGYFTFKMLNVNCVIGCGIKGIDGDKKDDDIKIQIKRWFRKHRPIRILTPEEKEEKARIFKERMNKYKMKAMV